VRPGKVFEHAAQVALLLQAADEMLFAETIRGELEFGCRFRAPPASPVLDIAGAVEFFGFDGLEHHSPWELSQGGRQRLAVFGLSVLPWFWLHPSRQRIRVLMVMVIGPALAGFWSQGMAYLPPPPIHFLYQFPWTISWLGSQGITTYGMIFGLQQSARVLVTVSTSMLILVTTDVGDFTWAFEKFRAPPQVGFALTAALRFLPEMISRTTLVLRAVELRGYDLSRPRWFEAGAWPDYIRRVARCAVLITTSGRPTR
jgi:hypothetical protein